MFVYLQWRLKPVNACRTVMVRLRWYLTQCVSHSSSKNCLQSLTGDVRKIETECLSEVVDHVCSSDIQVLPDNTGVSAALASGAP